MLRNEKISVVLFTLQTNKRYSSTNSFNIRFITAGVYPKKTQSIAANILERYAGKDLLIVGHSNTVVPFSKALECGSIFKTLTDADYNILFKVIINDKEKPRLLIKN